jgi:hypothetical protein
MLFQWWKLNLKSTKIIIKVFETLKRYNIYINNGARCGTVVETLR